MINRQPIALGNGDFRQYFPIQRFISRDSIQHYVSGHQWVIAFGKWKQLQAAQYCKALKESSAIQLYLHNNLRPQIVRQISHISFANLKCLMITSNMISSIQALQEMSCPRLKQLWLGSNRISQFKSFRKIRFPYLTKLSIQNNKIPQINQLQNTWLPLLETLDLNQNIGQGTLISIDNFLWKIQSQQIQQLRFSNQMAIPNIQRVRKRRSKMIQMHDH